MRPVANVLLFINCCADDDGALIQTLVQEPAVQELVVREHGGKGQGKGNQQTKDFSRNCQVFHRECLAEKLQMPQEGKGQGKGKGGGEKEWKNWKEKWNKEKDQGTDSGKGGGKGGEWNNWTTEQWNNGEGLLPCKVIQDFVIRCGKRYCCGKNHRHQSDAACLKEVKNIAKGSEMTGFCNQQKDNHTQIGSVAVGVCEQMKSKVIQDEVVDTTQSHSDEECPSIFNSEDSGPAQSNLQTRVRQDLLQTQGLVGLDEALALKCL